jgi:hypothetical protein
MTALALFPSLVAVTFVVPAARAVTRPAALTDATDDVELVHVTVLSDSTFPLPSRSTALSCWVPPTVRLPWLVRRPPQLPELPLRTCSCSRGGCWRSRRCC